MTDQRPRSPLRHALAAFGGFLDAFRKTVLNLLLLAVGIAVMATAFSGCPKVPKSAALVVRPVGTIVEQISFDPSGRLVGNLIGTAVGQETLLKDLLDAIRAAKTDPRIKALFLDLDDMTGAGMTKLKDLAAAIRDFKTSGKRVVAYADFYAQSGYFLAAQADEVYLHPLGIVFLEGFGGYRAYYREGLDKLGVQVHVFRVGEYKSAVEPYLRNDMSKDAREAALDVYGDLWRSYLADVASARKLKPEEIQSGIENLPERIQAAGGDFAKTALLAKLVDRLAPRDEVRKRMIEITGEDKKAKTFQQVSVAEYLEARGGDRTGASGGGDAVAVIVAKGEILDGAQPPGRIGGDSTAALVRQARHNDKAKALVLRVDSPGGSAFASEVVRRECALARQSGKPVIVSMGSVAASGGYWISTASDEIWAAPETITGSIGIFAAFPTIDRPLAKYLGVHVDGVGTTRFTDAIRPDRPMQAEVERTVQAFVNHGYQEFLARVAEARKRSPEDIDKIARGRIWSGEDARRLGLVDQLGGLDQAIESAAQRAKLAKGYRVWYVEKARGFRERILGNLFAYAARWTSSSSIDSGDQAAAPPAPVWRALRSLQVEVARLALWNDPQGLYAHCLCSEE